MKQIWATLHRTLSKQIAGLLLLVCIILIPTNMVCRYYAGNADPMQRHNTLALCVMICIVGFTRICRSHPAFNQGYLCQLTLSPWQHTQPLIRGPVYLFWADAVIVTLFMLLACILPVLNIWLIPLAFLTGYNMGLLGSFLATGQIGYIGLYIVIAPLLVYPHLNSTLTLLVTVAMTAIGLWGVRDYFKQFPWNTAWWKADFIEGLKQKSIQQRIIQWPFSELSITKESSIGIAGAAIISAVFFWWIHVINWTIMQEDGESVSPVYGFVIVLAIVLRIFNYMLKYRPPINIWGRITTGRLIIPGYDKVLIAPIIIAVIVPACMIGMNMLGVSADVTIECVVSLSIFLAIALPPSMEKWHYTGLHRIRKVSAKPTRTTPRPTHDIPVLSKLR